MLEEQHSREVAEQLKDALHGELVDVRTVAKDTAHELQLTRLRLQQSQLDQSQLQKQVEAMCCPGNGEIVRL